MKLVVGLGNPGAQYTQTRHNIGFMAADALAARLDAPQWHLVTKFKAFTTEIDLEGEKVVLAKPDTFMNNSGEAVQKLVQFYKIDPTDVVIIYDEIDLPMGDIRVRNEGSSGGHRGVESVISHLGPNFTRVRIGIDPNDRVAEPSEVYVLKPFNALQRAKLSKAVDEAVEVVLGNLS